MVGHHRDIFHPCYYFQDRDMTLRSSQHTNIVESLLRRLHIQRY